MEKFRDYNMLQAMLAQLTLEKEEEKKRRKDKKDEEKRKSEEKKAAAAAKEKAEKERLLPRIKRDVDQGVLYVLTQNAQRLKQILIYYYDENKTKINKMKKEELKELIRNKMPTEDANYLPNPPSPSHSSAQNDSSS